MWRRLLTQDAGQRHQLEDGPKLLRRRADQSAGCGQQSEGSGARLVVRRPNRADALQGQAEIAETLTEVRSSIADDFPTILPSREGKGPKLVEDIGLREVVVGRTRRERRVPEIVHTLTRVLGGGRRDQAGDGSGGEAIWLYDCLQTFDDVVSDNKDDMLQVG